MFCFQCEQTAKGEGCTKIGVCGKQPDVAALQDLLIYAVKGLSQVALEAGKAGVIDPEADKFAYEAIFSTLTNVDFDPQRFVAMIRQCVNIREKLKTAAKAAGASGAYPDGPAAYTPAADLDGLVKQGEGVGIKADPNVNPDILSLRELIVYGIKGVARHAHCSNEPLSFQVVHDLHLV